MKRRTLRFIMEGMVSFFLLLACFGCNDDDAAKLTQKWQMQQVVNADGSVQQMDSVFYNFMKGTFTSNCLMSDGTSDNSIVGTYQLVGDSIFITIIPERAQGITYSRCFAWKDGVCHYYVSRLTNNKLVLVSKEKTCEFRKY
jgi:hypothetical protein